MKIMVAQSAVARRPDLDAHVEALIAALETAGHNVQRMDLPTIENAQQALSTLASYRLLGTNQWADALICLDAVAAVLSNERKFVWLLDDGFLDADGAIPSELGVGAGDYVANVLSGGLNEAQARFAASREAFRALKTAALDSRLLRPGQWAPLLKALGR